MSGKKGTFLRAKLGLDLVSCIAIVLDTQRATIFHDADDYTARSTDPKAEIPIRHTPQLRPVQ